MSEYKKKSSLSHIVLEGKKIKILFVCIGNVCRSPLAANFES